MNTRPTPETDAAKHDMTEYGSPVPCSWGDWIPVDVAKRLECERDEAREQRDRLAEALRIVEEGTSFTTPSDIFIRLAEKRETTGKNQFRAMNALPEKVGYEVTFKPYGEKGRGFYYAPLPKTPSR